MCARSLRGNREISSLTVGASTGPRPASGRRGAEADDERAGEVRLGHTSEEACEQGRATGCGVGGAKGWDRGEHGPSTHATDSAPSKRVTGAGTCTGRCKAAEEGEVQCAAASRHDRRTEDRVHGAQA